MEEERSRGDVICCSPRREEEIALAEVTSAGWQRGLLWASENGADRPRFFVEREALGHNRKSGERNTWLSGSQTAQKEITRDARHRKGISCGKPRGLWSHRGVDRHDWDGEQDLTRAEQANSGPGCVCLCCQAFRLHLFEARNGG